MGVASRAVITGWRYVRRANCYYQFYGTFKFYQQLFSSSSISRFRYALSQLGLTEYDLNFDETDTLDTMEFLLKDGQLDEDQKWLFELFTANRQVTIDSLREYETLSSATSNYEGFNKINESSKTINSIHYAFDPITSTGTMTVIWKPLETSVKWPSIFNNVHESDVGRIVNSNNPGEQLRRMFMLPANNPKKLKRQSDDQWDTVYVGLDEILSYIEADKSASLDEAYKAIQEHKIYLENNKKQGAEGRVSDPRLEAVNTHLSQNNAFGDTITGGFDSDGKFSSIVAGKKYKKSEAQKLKEATRLEAKRLEKETLTAYKEINDVAIKFLSNQGWKLSVGALPFDLSLENAKRIGGGDWTTIASTGRKFLGSTSPTASKILKQSQRVKRILDTTLETDLSVGLLTEFTSLSAGKASSAIDISLANIDEVIPKLIGSENLVDGGVLFSVAQGGDFDYFIEISEALNKDFGTKAFYLNEAGDEIKINLKEYTKGKKNLRKDEVVKYFKSGQLFKDLNYKELAQNALGLNLTKLRTVLQQCAAI